jgi:signal transduction histidine kinase
MVFEDVELVAERERIAKDLHERVLHSLFGVGLELQQIAHTVGEEGTARRMETCVERLDCAIADLRASVFGLDVGEPNEQELG